MTGTCVHFVGGLFHDDLECVTAAGLAALERAEQIVFPGDWIGIGVQKILGGRLSFGRDLTVGATVRLLMRGRETVLLYGGDPMLFTGRPGFPSALELAELLRQRGARVVLHPGVSSVQWALAKARVEIPYAGAPLLVSSYFAGSDCVQGFVETHPVDTFLALLWFEDRIAAAWEGLERSRGDQVKAYLVRGGTTSETAVVDGTIESLRRTYPTLAGPAVLLVEPVAGRTAGRVAERVAAPSEESAGSRWARSEAQRILDSDPAQVVWITGIPGSGKSTLLRAIQRLSPDSRCVELADVVATIAPPGPPSQGGAQRNAAAADFVRSVAALGAPSRRWFVASAALKATSLGPRSGESVYIIDTATEVCRARLATRSGPPAWHVSADDLRVYERIRRDLRACSHVTVISQSHSLKTALQQHGRQP